MESAALILSVINGLALFRNYWRDRATLKLTPIHPEVYQWWFPLPGGVLDGNSTRAYGFLVYIGIANSGLRKVQIRSWRLRIRNRLGGTTWLKPLNMPDLELIIGDQRKFLPVLGQTGVLPGDTLVDAGCSISGVAFYRYECYGGDGWDPLQLGDTIHTRFFVDDVFGGKWETKVRLRLKSPESIQKFAPGLIESIQKIHKSAGEEDGA